ncbi:RNA polymerase sigma-70 factor [Sphingobacterium phlebotomi]|uniref:RNA polymerase sigma-70 factor n=1 Tax=Sphingobacterium phlebotomi TaxID=2605433 RepID=A0A5D4HA18_9SPHI|nr:RNA polymerase sigma-70 factor [Sphingobacterium phlebotomi]TYR37477.1 RNA polymerase sigma-70 factor [Sphingobacterium phlebotomi]
MYNQQMDHSEEVKLLVALQSGSQAAFEQIYRKYSARIYLNVLKMVKSEGDARELLQDVFFKVWTKRELIDPDQSFRSYLYQIAKYTVYNFIRRNNLEKQVYAYIRQHTDVEYSHIEEDLSYKESEIWLTKAIEQLPPQRRQVFTLCKIEGKSYSEVSELLGISPSTINDHIVKATKFIKERYNDRGNVLLLTLAYLLVDSII